MYYSACYDVLAVLRGATTLLFDEPANAPAPPTFGPYRVLHQIGSGVLGPVFRAEDTRQDRIVAVKAFALELVPEQVDRFTEALRSLVRTAPDHRSAVSGLDAGLEGHTPYLAMAFETRETLDQLLRRDEAVSGDRIAALVAQLAEVLDAFAAEECLHGALHPRDVFVTASGTGVRVTGFGVSQAFAAAGIRWPGRRPYASPERTGGDWDARADVYALGVIAHELLTGRKPLRAGEQDGEFGPEVSLSQRPRLRRLLATVLAERPEDRFQSAGAFSAALSDVLGQTLAPRTGEPLAMPALTQGPPDPDVESAAERPEPRLDEVHAQSLHDQDWMLTADRAGRLDLDPRLDGRNGDDIAYLAFGSEQSPDAELVEARRWNPGEAADDADDVEPGRDEGGVPRRWPSLVAVAFAGLFLGALIVVASVQGGWVSAPSAPDGARSSAVAGLDTREIAPEMETPPLPEYEEDGAPVPDSGGSVVAPGGAEAATLPPATAPVEQASPQAGPGRLVVESNIEGALVTIDGRIVGSTPATVRGLPLGSYAVQVARPGYVPARMSITLTAAAPARTLRLPLEPGLPQPGVQPAAGPAGAIDVDSRPRGARVSIDGRFVGHAPLRLADLEPGTHALTVEMTGYARASHNVRVEPGAVARLVVELEN